MICLLIALFWIFIFAFALNGSDDASYSYRSLINLFFILAIAPVDMMEQGQFFTGQLSDLAKYSLFSVLCYNLCDNVFMLATNSKYIIPYVLHHLFVIIATLIPLLTDTHYELIPGGWLIEFTSLILNITLLWPSLIPHWLNVAIFAVFRSLGCFVFLIGYMINSPYASDTVNYCTAAVMWCITIFSIGAVFTI